jgi:lipopolysaccharide cholinephosphotransferase
MSTTSATCLDQAVHFISDMNASPEYGYQDNVFVGVGMMMMHGGKLAISMFNDQDPTASAFESTIRKVAAVVLGILTLPLTLLGMAIKAIASLCPEKVGNVTDACMTRTSPHIVDQVYDLSAIANDLFRKHHINYFMVSGTLLGAVRHGGMIPWDDDGDWGMMKSDEEKLKGLAPELKDLGIQLLDNHNGVYGAYKLRFTEAKLEELYGKEVKEPADLDVFLYEETEKGKVMLSSTFFRMEFPKEYFLKEELQDLVDYPFGPAEKGLMLRGVRKPERNLKTYYGDECLDFGVHTHSHTNICGLSVPIPTFS